MMDIQENDKNGKENLKEDNYQQNLMHYGL